ncbi:MAG: hypothetical protein R6U95_08415 [Bacteroidales bacterium]
MKVQSIIFLLCVGLSFVQCSKKRVDPDLTKYESLEKYFDSLRPEEQEYIIDTLGTCPVEGKYGTRVCIDKQYLESDDDEDVYFPYTLKLVELYSIEDMIYYFTSHSDNGALYSCDGIVRVRFFKDDYELNLRDNSSWKIEIPHESPRNNAKIMYEDVSEKHLRLEASQQIFEQTEYGYESEYLYKLGWIAVGKNISNTQTYNLSLTSDVDDLETLTAYVYVPGYNNLVHVQHFDEEIAVPEQAEVKVVCMGMDAEKQLYQFYTHFRMEKATEVSVECEQVSESQFINMLKSL